TLPRGLRHAPQGLRGPAKRAQATRERLASTYDHLPHGPPAAGEVARIPDKMPRPKRNAKTKRLSISVSPETHAMLREAADEAYGGSVSAVVEAIAPEAKRIAAADWLLARAPPIDEAEYQAFLREAEEAVRGRRPRRRR